MLFMRNGSIFKLLYKIYLHSSQKLSYASFLLCISTVFKIRRFHRKLKIIWSDDATFTKNGLFNISNYHYCKSRDNLMFIVPIRTILFYDKNLNGTKYLKILQNQINPYLDSLPEVEAR